MQKDVNVTNNKLEIVIFYLISTILIGLFLFLCIFPFFTSILTGQVCPPIPFPFQDTTPNGVEDRYIYLVVDALRKGEESKIRDGHVNAKEEIESVKLVLSDRYEIIGGDNSFGLRERIFQFDNKKVVHMLFSGGWDECPDFNVTDQEILESFRLVSIYVEEE